MSYTPDETDADSVTARLVKAASEYADVPGEPAVSFVREIVLPLKPRPFVTLKAKP